MRVTVPDKNPLDISALEYSKEVSLNKYYKVRLKTVLCSAIYFRNYQKDNIDDKVIPSMVIAGLESQIMCLYQFDKNWCVTKKLEDFAVPSSIEEIKNGDLNNYVNFLMYFKDLCLKMKHSLKTTHSMKTT